LTRAGGRNFFGKGEKITDFLVKNGLTDNLALIEIKTPQTKLLGGQYRSGVYSASRDLVGCVTQVLDQRHKMQAELNTRKINSRLLDVEAYAVRGLIIIGRTPDAPEQRKSLELLRNNLHDVLVITFDELLEKLRHLHTFLSSNDINAAEIASSLDVGSRRGKGSVRDDGNNNANRPKRGVSRPTTSDILSESIAALEINEET